MSDALKRLRQERADLRATLEWVLAAHTAADGPGHDCLMCQRIKRALGRTPAGARVRALE